MQVLSNFEIAVRQIHSASFVYNAYFSICVSVNVAFTGSATNHYSIQ